MTQRFFCMALLCLVFFTPAFNQSTTVALKIGNNGNLSLNNKFYSGNYTELNQFGNGYQGGVEIKYDLTNFLGIKLEGSYVNSNAEIDHESYVPTLNNEKDKRKIFYEEIFINRSAFNISSSAVVNIGPVKLGIGPELSYLLQSVGRGSRYYFSDSLNRNIAQPVQYRFFSKRKQVYNLEDPNELHAYDVNRIMYGFNLNLNIAIYNPFSIELKTFVPMNDFVEEFLQFDNKIINQKSITGQVSIVYTFPINLKNKGQHHRKSRHVNAFNKKRFSSARLKKVEPRKK